MDSSSLTQEEKDDRERRQCELQIQDSRAVVVQVQVNMAQLKLEMSRLETRCTYALERQRLAEVRLKELQQKKDGKH